MVKRKETVGIALMNALGQNIPISLDKRKGFVSLFMNSQRRKLFHYLCRYPCSNMRMISRDMDIGLPSARWHLDHLKRMGFIEYKDIGKFKVFYPNRFIDREYAAVYALLNKDQARSLLNAVLAGPGIDHQELSVRTELGTQTLGGWIKKFEEVGMITTVKDGRNNRYFPTVLVSEMEKMERSHRIGFKRYILNKLHQDGVNPQVSKSTGNLFILDIKVGSDIYSLTLSLNPLRTILDGRDHFLREFPPEKERGREGGSETEEGEDAIPETAGRTGVSSGGDPGAMKAGAADERGLVSNQPRERMEGLDQLRRKTRTGQNDGAGQGKDKGKQRRN